MSRRGWTGYLALGHRARAFGDCDCAGERRRFWYPGAKRIRAGHIVCGYCRGRGAVIDVLESGDDDSGAGHSERNRMWPASSPMRRTPRNSAARFRFGGTSNTAEAAFVPSSYMSYQLSPNFWLGMAINAPFGLSMNSRIGGRVVISVPVPPTCTHTMPRRASLTASMTGSASAPACRSNMRTEVLTRRARPDTGPASRHQGQWLGLRLHRWRHFDANADDDDRHWLALIP